MTDAGKNEIHLDEQVEEEEEQLTNGVEENSLPAEDHGSMDDNDEGKEDRPSHNERRGRGRGRGRGFHNHGYSHPAHAAAYYHQVREINHLGGSSQYPVVNNTPAIPGVVGRLLKVSAKSNPKTVAGSIAHTCRGGETATLMATGAVSINQAVKAIAIARGYLEENKIDLTVRPEFRNEERGAVTLLLNKAPLRARSTAAPEAAESELRVAQASEPSVVAGSIAKKIRGGERVSIVAIGAAAVTGGLRAVTIGRRYLEKDGLDLTFRPEFVHVSTPDGGARGDEGQRSAIKLQVLAQQI